MPASSYQQVWNIEGNVEKAFADWLSDNGIHAFVSEDQETLPDNYVAIELNLGPTTNHINTDIDEYDQFSFTLNLVVRSRRRGEEGSQSTNIKSRQQELVALVRTWMGPSKAKGSALETYLVNSGAGYEIERCEPSGTEYDYEMDSAETTLTYEGELSILQSAWPVS